MSTKKLIGRIPVSKGEYVAGQTYNRLSQVTLYGSTYQSRVDGNTSAPAILDAEGNAQHANTDQWLVIADGREAYNAGEKLSCFSLTEDDKYLALEVDAYDRILASTNIDGSHYSYNMHSETIDSKQDKEDGKGLIDKDFASAQSVEDDKENRLEIKKDLTGKIISWRDKNGYLHENEIEVGCLRFTEDGLTDFQKLLVRAGLKGGCGDWSNYLSNDGESPLCIPEPRCAYINITGITSMPSTKTDNLQGYMEFYDMQGNYFKKKVIVNAQGNSSMGFQKKNIALDLFDEDWGGNAFFVKFGDWIAMDSFHLKAYYTDSFRGSSIIAYKIAEDVDRSWGCLKDRTWKRALLDSKIIGNDLNGVQPDNLSIQIDNGAKCMPMGFPCIVLLNGEFYGIYAWCIKKHRDNYMMKKDNPKHIHLDGELTGDSRGTIFSGKVNWAAFEIRNPKYLVYQNAIGSSYEYNADKAQAEIAGLPLGGSAEIFSLSTSYSKGDIVSYEERLYMSISDNNIGNAPLAASYKSKPKDVFKKATENWIEITFTNEVKKAILQFSARLNEIDAEESTEQKKLLIDKYFDHENLIDYFLVQSYVGDSDGFRKNWQWTTWDATKWFVNEYDKDMSFGNNFLGTFIMPPYMTWVNYSYNLAEVMVNQENGPMYLLKSLYKEEISSRYAELRKLSVFSVENVIGKMSDWLYRIGETNFDKEYNLKWKDCVCNRDMKIADGWELYDFKTFGTYFNTSQYDSAKTYNAGDVCKSNFMCFKATKTITGTDPVVKTGHRDSIFRLYNWLSERQRLLDNYYKYINE